MISRRKFLGTGTAAAVSGAAGLAVGAVGANAATQSAAGATLADSLAHSVGRAKVDALGANQAGIELELQSHTRFIALDILPETDRRAMVRYMQLLADDIARLTNGEPVLADPQPQLAEFAARLTVTIGFGPSLFAKLGLESAMPAGFAALPSFKIDQLDPALCDGDLLLHISCDDLPMLNHAARSLLRDSTSFATQRWSQDGFANAQGVVGKGVRQRNMMGQVDGTDNPELGSEDFANVVWMRGAQPWANGGTQLVLRRIRMELGTWDTLGTDQKEQIIGRKLSNGAPIGGVNETDVPDFGARNEAGLHVIPDFAHIRNAAARDMKERFFRRPFNYVDGASGETGLLWTAYSANLTEQFLPVQKRLANGDLLNKWTTPVGSAVFVIPAGFDLDSYPGRGLF